MKDYLKPNDLVITELNSSIDGLSTEDANQRQEKYGKNALKEAKTESLFVKFLKQLAEPMLIILMVAALLSLITSTISGHTEWAEAIIILAVVLINSILGVFQESKAEAAIAALNQMSKAKTKVLRDGVMHIIDSEELVPGDIILLEAGDNVPADARLLEAMSLKAEEAALTGESVPTDKNTETLTDENTTLGERHNMIYMGTNISYGRAKAIITETGMNTEMGKIATAIDNAKEGETPLQKKLNQLSKTLTYLVLGISVVIIIINLVRQQFTTGITINSLMSTFMIAISLAVAAIPEGLAAVVTIVLSMGVTKMSKNRAIVRKLTAVETLGCTQIICSDKTGTLTQNKMTVVDEYTDDKNLLALSLSLCSDSKLDEKNEAIGEATENALVNYAFKNNINKNILENGEYKRVSEAPFDSQRKLMSSIHTNKDKFIQFTKGAPDELIAICNHILKDGKVVPFTKEEKEIVLKKNTEYAHNALRVLASAYKDYSTIPSFSSPSDIEKDLIFIGLACMKDPIRPEVKDAIVLCTTAGIRPVMITGDHVDTATAIGKEIGILKDGQVAITGKDLDKLSDEEFMQKLESISVYARVQPDHKVRIVNAWKEKGKITAMTGDGVNDAPSIKNADIGIGMGITGTDVTKNVADMVLADDNFATIISAVKEGRRIYDNIRKAVQFLIASNLAEVISIFVASLLGFTILKPAHILWINLITDAFPAIALGMEKEEKNVMDRLPRDPKESLFANGIGINCIIQGVVVAGITLLSYFIGEYIETGVWQIANSNDGMTMAFLTLSMAQIFHSFNMRSLKGSIFKLNAHNKYLWLSFIGSFLATVVVLYVPFLRDAFGFNHITLYEFAIAIGLALSIIPIVEITKLIQRKAEKK